jgi:hypothetical protein
MKKAEGIKQCVHHPASTKGMSGSGYSADEVRRKKEYL